MTKCTLLCVPHVSQYFGVRANDKQCIDHNDNSKVKVVGLLPETRQLPWFKEKACVLIPKRSEC